MCAPGLFFMVLFVCHYLLNLKTNNKLMDFIFLLGRVLFGMLFLYNGWSHFMSNTQNAIYAQARGVPMPRIVVFVTGLMLILGGLGIILGVYVKLSIILLALFLLGTLFRVHNFWKEKDPSTRAAERSAFLKNAALLGALLMFLTQCLPFRMD
jgi:putative oxidoreductase